MQEIINYINQTGNIVLVLGYIILGIVYISSFFTFRKFPLFETLLVFLTIALTAFSFIIRERYNIVLLNIELKIWVVFIVFAVDVLLFITRIAKLAKFKNTMRFYELTPSNIETNIYAYLDKKSNIIMYTAQFYNAIGKNNKKVATKKWYKSIQKLICDDQEMTFPMFLKYIKEFGEKVFYVDITFNEFINFKTELKKTMVSEGNKIKGYIIYNQKLTPLQVYKDSINSEYSTRMFNFFNSMNEAIAYFDNSLNQYVLTDAMMRSLNEEKSELSSLELSKYVVDSDLFSFNKMLMQKEGELTSYFRLKTQANFDWFMAVKKCEGIYSYILIRRAYFIPFNFDFMSSSDLEKSLDELVERKEKFVLVFLSIKNAANYSEKLGKELTDVLINAYFNKLARKDVYKLSAVDYAILIKDAFGIESLLSEISTSTSNLFNLDVVFNGIKYPINNSLGIVKSDSLSNPSVNGYLSAAYEALSLANNQDYNQRFSIYKEVKQNNNKYQFDNYKVDLDNDFLYGKKKV